MSQSKLVNLSEAIFKYIKEGCSVAMGLSLESLIPFAAGHEIVRQKKRNLTLIGPISDMLFDQVVGAECVCKIQAAWVGNVITGSGYNLRRAVEQGKIEMEDHSNLTMAMGLWAGAMGVPFIPSKTALGSDLFKTNLRLKKITCPFTHESLTAVRAINPDVSIIHAQRSDKFGNAHVWGNLGVSREACLASEHIIVTTEKIVSNDVITSDPNRIIVPGFKVNAVVQIPWGAHPSPVPGYYNRDHESFLNYSEMTKKHEGYLKWKARWIDSVENEDDYQKKVGGERLNQLRIKHHNFSGSVDYGY